jgi:hypothetical protein
MSSSIVASARAEGVELRDRNRRADLDDLDELADLADLDRRRPAWGRRTRARMRRSCA